MGTLFTSTLLVCVCLIIDGSYSEKQLASRKERQAPTVAYGVAFKPNYWTKGVVPYVFSSLIRQNTIAVESIQAAMKELSEDSCIKFKGRDRETDYLSFITGSGCWHAGVGKSGGQQKISFADGCNTTGMAIHNIAHALGMFHEEQRSDRDNYVTIKKQNGLYEFSHKIKRHNTKVFPISGQPYDYGSVMHGGRYFLSRNGKETIVPKKPLVTIGQRNSLSKQDLIDIKLLYRCPVDGEWSPWGPWTACTVTCGGLGTRERVRNCNRPAPSNGGQNCFRDQYLSTHSVDCGNRECSVGKPACKSGWTAFEESCYKLFTGQSKGSQVLAKCSEYDAYGTSILSERENNFIKAMLPRNLKAWIGLGNPTEELEKWKWDDGSTYSYSKLKGPQREGYWCVNIFAGNWYTSNCISSLGYFCKRRPKVCRKGWTKFEGACYIHSHINDDPQQPAQSITIRDETNRCKSAFGAYASPLSIHSQREHLFIQGTILNGKQGYVWLGIKRKTTTWKWSDGSPFDYKNWENGEAGRSDRCAYMGPTGAWKRGQCTGTHKYYICKYWYKDDGSWSEWSSWTTCTKSCENGTTTRTRACTNPSPRRLGRNCAKDSKGIGGNEILNCNPHQCPVHGGWSRWTKWIICPVSCGGGKKSRYRSCTNPTPKHGGNDCAKDLTGHGSRHERPCNQMPCPHWNNWSEWGECSVTCGGGNRTRQRSCLPLGVNCTVGPSGLTGHQLTSCNTKLCKVNGGWATWESWNYCSVTCGDGTRSRRRTCTNPVPKHGGSYCLGGKGIGGDKMVSKCNERTCVYKTKEDKDSNDVGKDSKTTGKKNEESGVGGRIFAFFRKTPKAIWITAGVGGLIVFLILICVCRRLQKTCCSYHKAEKGKTDDAVIGTQLFPMAYYEGQNQDYYNEDVGNYGERYEGVGQHFYPEEEGIYEGRYVDKANEDYYVNEDMCYEEETNEEGFQENDNYDYDYLPNN